MRVRVGKVVRVDWEQLCRERAGALYHVNDINVYFSCPAHARLLARNGLVNEVKFLGLITQME